MKRILLFVSTCLLLGGVCAAQTPIQLPVQYGYDNAGNRISRWYGIVVASPSETGDSSLVREAVQQERKEDAAPDILPDSLSRQRKEAEAYFKLIPSRSLRGSNAYVGCIPLQEGVSPSGARTYTIPITVAPDAKFPPGITLSYNSQAGDGLAGYGWDIAGISRISLINRNIYYHGQPKAAQCSNPDAVFALDGNPLVQNDDNATMASYPLATATGHIIAKQYVNAGGFVTSFEVRYPNGVKATYGLGLNVQGNFPSYPVTGMEDLDGNRVTFTYTVDSVNGNYRIDKIYYNYDANNDASSQIEFNYIANTDYPTRYFAGRKVFQTHRLSSVVSKNQNYQLAFYSLRHIYRDNVHLLTQVGCTNGIDSLPPLTFDYGDWNYWQGAATATLEKDATFQYSNSAPMHAGCVYRRGKFMKNSYHDGLLFYPNYSNYDKDPNNPKYVSPYPSTQRIMLIPRLSDGSPGMTNYVDSSIVAGSGFQTMEAVDVDGDGQDELVKVNFNGTSGSKTVLTITVLKCNDYGIPLTSSTFNVQVNGTITSGNDVSPYRRAYYWGDFTGQGSAQLLTIAYDTNGDNISQTCYAALIDLKTHTVLFDQYLFDYSLTDTKNVLVMDIDSDGRSELCHAHANGFDVLRLSSGNTFSVEQSFSLPDAYIVSQEHTCFTDLNADGYLDIMWPVGTSGLSQDWYRFAYTGESFDLSIIPLGSVAESGRYMYIDVNRDGYPDLVRVTSTTMGVRLNQNGSCFGAYRQTTTNVADSLGILPANIMEYGAMSGFIKVEGAQIQLYKYGSLSPRIRYLRESEDGFGKLLVNYYQYLPSRSCTWTTSTYSPSVSQGYAKRPLPIYVLSGEIGALLEDYTFFRDRSYEYDDAVVHNKGLGFCGFARIKTYENYEFHTMQSECLYNPEKRGALTQMLVRDGATGSSPVVSTQVNTYDDHTTTYGKQNPRLIQSVVSDNVRGITDTTAITYGTYDYPSEIVSIKAQNGSTARQTETKQCTYVHGTAPNRYVLGIVTEEALIKETDGNSTLSWKERVVTTYDTLYHPSNKKVYVGQYGRIWGAFHHHIDYDATNLVSETCWQYDARGNVISEMTAPYGATEFIGKSFTYDNDGRHVLTSTNALGQTTTYSGYNRWGKPTSSVDFRNLTTSYQYDSWGNLTRVTRPDGGETQTTATWGGEKCYYVTKTATGAPDEVLHYDGANREVRSGRKRFDGQWQYVDKEYDMQGNVSRVSLPFRGTSASYWNRYTYDHLNRPLAVVEASGKTTTWSYSGTGTTTVKDGITSTSTTDAGGRVVSVTDAGGTITYAFRDDGQPSSVTAPGNVSTTFSYDEYGRRTQIVDPSAGTQTDAYVWNSDGSSSSTHTNPNGAVTTSLDKFGRTTSVTRQGDFSTSYTYNTDGLLTAEISTNGTRKSYSYDNLGRLATVRDSCSDGRFLTKELSYLTGSVLEQVSYSTQSGPIVDEIYNYAYGNLQSVTTDGNLTVWSLTAENALGQPTSVVTGTVSRTYGFNAYGIPSYRKMAGGILQDFEYSFNASTGNLSERYDVGNVTLERFYYDNLNRLADTDDRSINYANNGNITSMSDVGSMSYGSGYKLLLFDPDDGALVPDRQQSISYTCFNRPSVLAEGGRSAAFTYNADGDRVKMAVTDSTGDILTRYYLGGRYECDSTAVGITERLYLGGDAYSAPMVLQKVNSGSWTAYNIGRDYLGSVTHIATASGTRVAEYSYDPWGRLRDPETLEIYYPGDEPELFLGRGFTGHEHLTWFGLINMNARLYDPLLGRFLSPDPYVQAPDFTQNLNRYSYALNNPLKYSDKSGEFVVTTAMIVAAAIGATVGLVSGYFIGKHHGATGWAMAGYIAGGGAIGAVGGFLSSYVGGIVAASASIGGFWGGALSGAAAGATAGAINGFGMTMLSGQGFSASIEQLFIQAGVGAASGAVICGVIGGVNARAQGLDYWTGRKSVINQTQYSLIEKPVPEINTGGIPESRDIPIPNDRYQIDFNESIATYPELDSRTVTLRIARPTIKGYNIRINGQIDTYHDFPRLFDELILNNAEMTLQSDGSYLFRVPGWINNKQGIYEMCINEEGIVYHHFFRPFK